MNLIELQSTSRSRGELPGQDILRLHHSVVDRLEYVLGDAKSGVAEVRTGFARTAFTEQNTRTGNV